MAVLRVPHSFFIKERQIYDGWKLAVVRELFQNSTDPSAGSSRISIDITVDGNMTKFVFTDNGVGMSRSVLENVYFTLGATTKEGEGSVGGFGRARVLTCFSMEQYEIETNSSHVIGCGAEYDINEKEFRQGCSITIWIKESEASVSDMMDACKEYLQYSWLGCDVSLNGKQWNDWLRRGRLTRELVLNDQIFANVYVNKSGNSINNHYLVVRVGGTMMYRRYIRVNASVLVEIDPAINRTVLVANRDQMVYKYQEVLNKFLDEIAIDSISALKVANKKSAVVRSGKISRIDFRRSVAPTFAGGASSFNNERVSALMNVDTNSLEYIAATFKSKFDGEARRVGTNEEVFVSNTIMPFDVHIVDETEYEDSKVRSVIDNYSPMNWGIDSVNGITYNKGGHKQKLLFIWYIVCRNVLESYCKFRETAASFSVGFVFGLANAMHREENDTHVFLLNPVDTDGKMKFGIRDKNDLRRMIAYARHEVTHIEEAYHNEDYARLLTEITALTEEKEILRLVMDYLKME